MAGDPHWSKVVLAMHMDGANGSTVFTDKKGNTVTRTGDAKISTAQSKFGGASAIFDGSSANKLTSAANSYFKIGGAPFTIEFWCYPTAANPNGGVLLGVGTSSTAFNSTGGRHYSISSENGSSISFQFWNGTNSTWMSTAANSFPINAWNHFAASYDGASVRLFTNGVLQSTTGVSVVAPSDNPSLEIGSIPTMTAGSTYGYTGYIDELRITKGVARYTADFTPPVVTFPNGPAMISGTTKDSAGAFAPRAVRVYRKSDGALAGATTSHSTTGAFAIPALDDTAHYAIAHDTDADPYWDKVVLAMHMDGANGSTVFTDLKGGVVTRVGGAQISTAQSRFGGGSLALSGTSQYLSVANTSVGAGDFTVEGGFYLNDLNNRGWLHFTSSASFPSATTGLAIGYDSTAVKLTLYIGSTPFQFDYTPPVSTWRHFAVARVGGTVSLYIHGVLVGSIYSNADLSTYSFLFIGGYYSASYLINGYIDDVRITKGVARYQADFTPPERAFREAMTAGTSNALIFDDLTPD